MRHQPCLHLPIQVTASSPEQENHQNLTAPFIHYPLLSRLQQMSRSNQCNHEDARSDDDDNDNQQHPDNDLSLNGDEANHEGPSTNFTASSNDYCSRWTTDDLPLLGCWSQHVAAAAAATQFGSPSRINHAAATTPSSASHTLRTATTVPNREAHRQLLYRMLQDAMRLCDTNDCDDIDNGSNNPPHSLSTTTATSRRRPPDSSKSPDKSNEQNSPDPQ
jgi:hypothetical protein